MPSAREKKHKGAQGEGVWKAEKEETARTTLLRPSNISKGITESASKAITFQAGSWSLQKANGPKNRVPASLTGGSWRRHCTAPISPGVTKEGEQQSFWHPPEEVRRGRAALPQHPPPAQAAGNGAQLPGTELHRIPASTRTNSNMLTPTRKAGPPEMLSMGSTTQQRTPST